MEIPKREKLLIIVSLSIFLILIGSGLNQLVVSANNKKMPVLTNKSFETVEHFSFNFEDYYPKYWILSDIISVKIKDIHYIFSVGDLFIFQGIIIIPFCLFYYSYLLAKIQTKHL